MTLREKLSIIGIIAVLTSPLYVEGIYNSINSESQRVRTSKGIARVVEWKNGRGRDVMTGGIPSCTIYEDKNYDGILDSKTHIFGAPRRGFFINHPQITSDDQKFYSEAIEATKIPEKRASWNELMY
jgi:hypothetical protein